jgi:hypothetical protein
MPRCHIWQSRPVFVISTFRDMQAERDCLREHVVRELEKGGLRCRRCAVEILAGARWGGVLHVP